ncbi:ABC transporter permease [Virgibacillus sp. NKC19-3]|uniref:ABC transporter permease n=1 Tax=Virgibacillus saliphilus TaxID=2831674 RepID=UPI001C9A570C|nr:ABC transporter permease [Virgibacillus sp. NKC19-3]MBY7141852.1 ABC transporter permease [Virgibacillus sp. NKC19-3]
MFLAIRELMHAKVRYILIGLIMVLIACLIFIISGLAQGLSADNASAIQHLNADYLLIDPDAELDMTTSFIPQEEKEDIAQWNGVEEASSLSIRMMNVSVNDSDQNADVALFVTEAGGMLMPPLSEGRAINDEHEVVVDDSLKQEGVEIGDTLGFGENSERTIVGFVENQRYSHTSVVFAHGGQAENINAIAIQGQEANIEALQDSFDVVTKEEALQGIPSYSQEQGSLNMMIMFLYVIAAFVLAAFFYVITLQKRDQFGVLKALGARTAYLVKNLISQVVLISILCIIIAVGLTLGVAALLPADMPFQLTAGGMLQTALLILLVSIIGAIISLVQVVKIDPIEAIEGAGK